MFIIKLTKVSDGCEWLIVKFVSVLGFEVLRSHSTEFQMNYFLKCDFIRAETKVKDSEGF